MRAIFAAGCFWGVQRTFDQIPGVLSTTVGFCGGHTVNPSYEKVCNGDTGLAEAIELFYDPEKVSYHHLLDVFWNLHTPDQAGKRTNYGEWQYRSAIFYYDDNQKQQAVESKEYREGIVGYRIATEILPAPPFYPASDYHQKYYLTHGDVC